MNLQEIHGVIQTINYGYEYAPLELSLLYSYYIHTETALGKEPEAITGPISLNYYVWPEEKITTPSRKQVYFVPIALMFQFLESIDLVIDEMQPLPNDRATFGVLRKTRFEDTPDEGKSGGAYHVIFFVEKMGTPVHLDMSLFGTGIASFFQAAEGFLDWSRPILTRGKM